MITHIHKDFNPSQIIHAKRCVKPLAIPRDRKQRLMTYYVLFDAQIHTCGSIIPTCCIWKVSCQEIRSILELDFVCWKKIVHTMLRHSSSERFYFQIYKCKIAYCIRGGSRSVFYYFVATVQLDDWTLHWDVGFLRHYFRNSLLSRERDVSFVRAIVHRFLSVGEMVIALGNIFSVFSIVLWCHYGIVYCSRLFRRWFLSAALWNR